jgi:radical SAM protein with 4Fe4S-binding SPASM domain
MARKPQYTSEGIRHATINGHRFHLRLIDASSESFLWVDGRSPPLIVDQVAAEFIAHLIDAMWAYQQGHGDETEKVRGYVIGHMYKRYGAPLALRGRRVTRGRIGADLDRIFGMMMAVAEGGCPVEAGLDMRLIPQEQWAAPARMDLALTYRCNLNCGHCYTGGPRETAEMDTDTWRRVLETLWSIGVPQVVFTGGEATLRDDLAVLVGQAEEFVTGLVTNGVLLHELAEPLRDANLDYVQVTLESHLAAIHDQMTGSDEGGAFDRTVAGIRQAVALGMEVVTNTTLTSLNADRFVDTLRFGKELGLRTMACNGLICSGRGVAAKRNDPLSLDRLKSVLCEASAAARELGIELQWYTPTCYHELNPLELGFGAKRCSAASQNMTIQPDGTVLPCQSWPDSVGHILEDRWDAIWNHPICRDLRSGRLAKLDERCAMCDQITVCGGGCPLERKTVQRQT